MPRSECLYELKFSVSSAQAKISHRIEICSVSKPGPSVFTCSSSYLGVAPPNDETPTAQRPKHCLVDSRLNYLVLSNSSQHDLGLRSLFAGSTNRVAYHLFGIKPSNEWGDRRLFFHRPRVSSLTTANDCSLKRDFDCS